ncbi:hypothetical protein HID58_047230, partial [Brassica napus]
MLSPAFGEGSSRRIQHIISPTQQVESQRALMIQRLGAPPPPPPPATKKRNLPGAATQKATNARLGEKKAPSGKVTGAIKTKGNSRPLKRTRTTKQLRARGRPPTRKRLCVERNAQSKDLPCLALLWRNEINLTVLSSSANFIDTEVVYKANTFFLTFIY